MAEEKRIVTDERRYAIMSRESIKLMADAAGHEETSDSVAGILGEDVSYRLREITQKSAQFMRHARRKRMNTDDFNKACGSSDIQPVLGHGSQEAVPSFQAVKVEHGEPIHFALDPTLNLATEASSTFIPKHSGETTIKAHWLVVEGVQKSTQNPQGTPGNKVEPGGPLMKYFDKITQAVLGNDEEMMKTALSDLRTNGNISPLLPHFVSFISNGVKTLGDDVCKLTRLLSMVQSLVYNSSLFLEAQPFLAVMSQSVQYCLLDPLVSSGQSSPTDDHWVLRDYAARVLAHIVGIWGNSVNHLERYTEKTLREALHDLSRPFACHYGAVMGLMYLGTESVERVLVPHLHVYMPHLLAALEFQGLEFVQLQTNAWSVHGAILLCVEHILQKYIKQFREENITDATNNGEAKKVFKTISDYDTKVSKRPSSNGFLSAFHKSPVSFYFEMFEYFGDALTLRLPEIADLKSHVFKPKERDLVTSISDPTADKSGEELLSELEEEVKREELMKKKQVKTEPVHLLDRHQRDRERRAASVRQQLKQRAAQQQKLDKFTPASDTDIEVIDVEGVDKLDFRARSSLAISSATCGAPGQGIKMTFAKRAKFTPDSSFSESFNDFTEIKERDRNEENFARKRKHSSPSPDMDFSQFLGGGIYPSSSFDSIKQRRRDPSFE